MAQSGGGRWLINDRKLRLRRSQGMTLSNAAGILSSSRLFFPRRRETRVLCRSSTLLCRSVFWGFFLGGGGGSQIESICWSSMSYLIKSVLLYHSCCVAGLEWSVVRVGFFLWHCRATVLQSEHYITRIVWRARVFCGDIFRHETDFHSGGDGNLGSREQSSFW